VDLVEGPAAWLRRCVELAGKEGPRPAVWGLPPRADLAAVAEAVPKGWTVRNPPAAMLPALVARGCKVLRRKVDPPLSSPVQPCPPPADVDLVAVAVAALDDACSGAEVAAVWAACCRQAGGVDLVAVAVTAAHLRAVARLDDWERGEHGAELRRLGVA
jgi:hypothetical protein